MGRTLKNPMGPIDGPPCLRIGSVTRADFCQRECSPARSPTRITRGGRARCRFTGICVGPIYPPRCLDVLIERSGSGTLKDSAEFYVAMVAYDQ
jgi:hypothetical protein